MDLGLEQQQHPLWEDCIEIRDGFNGLVELLQAKIPACRELKIAIEQIEMARISSIIALARERGLDIAGFNPFERSEKCGSSTRST